MPDTPNDTWSMDCIKDQSTDGGSIRTLTALDNFNPEGLTFKWTSHFLQRVSGEVAIRLLNSVANLQLFALITAPNTPAERGSLGLTRRASVEYTQAKDPKHKAYIELYNRTVRHAWRGQYIFKASEEAQDESTEWL